MLELTYHRGLAGKEGGGGGGGEGERRAVGGGKLGTLNQVEICTIRLAIS